MESRLLSRLSQNVTTEAQPFARDLLISFKDPLQLWEENWFALALEVVSALILYQVFRNAKKNDPQLAYLILAAATTTVSFEILPIIPRPGYLLWWYHQGVVNVLKQRVPSYVASISALIFYMAHCLTRRSNLPCWTRSVITGIFATLIMLPCLWLAPRLLLQLLHFDDQVFKDKVAGIPYIQVVVVILMFFHTSYLFHQNVTEIDPRERNTYSYMKCSLQSGLASAVYALFEQYMLYILFTLTMGMNTAICLVVATLILIFLTRQDIREMQMTSYSIQGIISPLMRRELWVVVGTMTFLSTLPLWLNIQNLKSTGDRLELGPCNVIHEVSNTSPLEVPRRRYICPDDANFLHFDFHCVSKKELMQGVRNKEKHYTICGKNFENPYQVTKHLLLYSACCVCLFYTAMLLSFTFKFQEKKIADGCKMVE